MIDLFALVLVHGLLAVMLLRLVGRDDLDLDPPPGEEHAAVTPPTGRRPRR